MLPVNISRITAPPKTRLTKKFTRLRDGTIQKEPSDLLTKAEVENIELDFTDLLDFFENLSPNQACCLGTHTADKNPVPLTCRSLSYLYPDSIHRTKQFFTWPSHGILLFDFDNTDIPPKDAPKIIHRLLDNPDLPLLIRPSSSAGIEKSEYHNYHIFVPYYGDPGEDLRHWVKAKLINMGFLKLDISKIGSVLVRTLVDTSVLSPERLFYCAPPILGQGVKRMAFKPFYVNENSSEYYRINLSDLIFQQSEANKKITQEKIRIEPKVKEIREEYLEEQAEKMSKQLKISKLQAKKQLSLHYQNYITEMDFLQKPDGERISAFSVLDGGFIGTVIKDPIEPDYQGGRPVAIILDRFTIHSFAHGSRIIKITTGPEIYERLLARANEEEEIADIIASARILNSLDLNKFIKITNKILSITKTESQELFRTYNSFYKSSFKIDNEKEFDITNKINLPKDATHAEIAKAFVDYILPKHSIFSGGMYYTYDDTKGIWQPQELKPALYPLLTEAFDGLTYLKRMADYTAVITNIAEVKSDVNFFADAPSGVATPEYFIQVDDETGEIKFKNHSPSHKARYQFPVSYSKKEPKEFLKFLHKQLGEEQTNLLQKVFGAVFFQKMYKFQQAVYFYGVAHSGKSTILEILMGMIPQELICNVSPFQFDKEYNRSLLANALVNISPELPKNKNIPSEIFKTIVSGEPIQAKLLYRNPIIIRPLASHLFAGNFLIKSEDTSAAFFRRWVIFEFTKTIPVEERVIDFASSILEKERNEIFSWSVRGYSNIVKEEITSLKTKEIQTEIEQEIEILNNSVLAFLMDDDYVVYNKNSKTARKTLYKNYIMFCDDMDMQRLSKLEFTKILKEKGFRIERGPDNVAYVKGIQLMEV